MSSLPDAFYSWGDSNLAESRTLNTRQQSLLQVGARIHERFSLLVPRLVRELRVGRRSIEKCLHPEARNVIGLPAILRSQSFA